MHSEKSFQSLFSFEYQSKDFDKLILKSSSTNSLKVANNIQKSLKVANNIQKSLKVAKNISPNVTSEGLSVYEKQMVYYDVNSKSLCKNINKNNSNRAGDFESDSGFLEDINEHKEHICSPEFKEQQQKQQIYNLGDKSEMLNSFINNFHEDNIHCGNFFFGNINDFDNERSSLSECDVITSYSSSSYGSGSESFYSCRSNSDPFILSGNNHKTEKNILNHETDDTCQMMSRILLRHKNISPFDSPDTDSEARRKRNLIKSCLYPETTSDDVIFQSSRENSQSDLCLNKSTPFENSSALTVRLREATTSAKRELRKKLQSWSDIFLTNSEASDRFTSYMNFSHSEEEINQNFILKPIE